MERFATSIEASIDNNNWLAALFMALAMPDICAALENPERQVGDRYKDWFNRYLKQTYNPENTYELLLATSPDAVHGWPPEAIESMKRKPASRETAFTAEDCYRLRCKCLHQGLPERMGQDRIHFTKPHPTGIQIHKCSFNGVLQISIDVFCKDVAKAVLVWWDTAQAIPEISTRAQQLIKIYGLDAQELPIVGYGS